MRRCPCGKVMKEHIVISEKSGPRGGMELLATAPAPAGTIKMFAPRSGLDADLSLHRLYFLFPALQGWIPVAE